MKKIYTLLVSIGCSLTIYGTTITVTNTNDSGAGSLRDAITNANSGDTVVMGASLANATITLASSITINNNIVINGNTNAPTTLTGQNARVFSVSSGVVMMSWLHFFNNMSSSGGAILNNATLSLYYCKFENNTSLVNSASHAGGAIYNNTTGELVIDHCVFDFNIVTPNPTATIPISEVRGGAIYHKGSVLLIYNSYFTNNQAIYNQGNTTGTAFGGAVYSEQSFEISNSTFYDNKSIGMDANTSAYGGAIYIYGPSNVNISFSTIAFNQATFNGGGAEGGNIVNEGNLVLQSSIVSNSTGPSNLYSYGSASTLGGNLLDDWTNSGITLSSSDLTGDPLLQVPAAYNSSFTKAAAIPCNSPAIDAGNATNAPTFDQVGQTRIAGSGIDIGAYEQQSTQPTVIASVQKPAICLGDTTIVTASITGIGTYSWDNGLGSGQAHSVSPASTTTYTVIATNSGGCSDTDQVTVTVNPLPVVTANASPSTVICQGDSVTLTGGGGSSYSWDNGVTDGMAFSPSSTTLYTVTGTDINNCMNTDTITVTVNVCTGIAIENKGADVVVYPNPVINTLTIYNEQFKSALILNYLGAVIKEINLINGENYIDVSELRQGYYLIQFASKNNVLNKPFIKN